MTGIYCIENLANGKRYIGQSKDIEERWRHHKWELRTQRHPNKHLLSAWNKFGEDSFVFYVLEECEFDEMNEKEIQWIEKFKSFGVSGYNMTAGGEGQFERRLTDEQRKHLSEINKGALNANFGKHKSVETKRKMSESAKARQRDKLSDEHKQKISSKLKGKKKPYFNKAVFCHETNMIYNSVSECSETLNIPIYSISRNCLGRRKSANGMHFDFVKEKIS